MRPATPADEPFLRQAVWLAHRWCDEDPPARPMQLDPDLARYVDGFGRPGDAGLVAEEGGMPIGAVWFRHVRGYGYVADDIPELTIGVVPEARGHGVGTALLAALLDLAASSGLRSLSLSVEPDNPALRLYQRAGFERTSGGSGVWTMIIRLDREH